MQQKKCFFKRTRKGKIIKLTQEKYLRTDTGCGYLHGCQIESNDLRNLVAEAPHKQLLIIDTNIALHQIDILDHRCPATSLVVVLQTVLQELRHLNLSVYRRLETLIRDESKSFIFYPNELSATTSVLRDPSESINDANDRAIRNAALYFRDVLTRPAEQHKANDSNDDDDDSSSAQSQVILITNDAANQAKAIGLQLQCSSMRAFVQQYVAQYPELSELLAHTSTSAAMMDVETTTGRSGLASHMPTIYPVHLTMTDLSSGLRSKRLMRGTLRVKRDDWTDCYVVVHTAEGQPRKSVVIKGRLNVNRAVDGDVVGVELLPEVETERERQSERLLDAMEQAERGQRKGTRGNAQADVEGSADWGVSMETAEATPDAIEGIEGAVSASAADSTATADSSGSSKSTSKASGSTQPLRGRVVGIIRRNWRQYAGSLDASGESDRVTGASLTSTTFGGTGAGSSADYCGDGGNGSGDAENSSSSAEAEASVLFYPVDGKLPPVRLCTRMRQSLLGHRLLVSMDEWPAHSMYPQGHYVRILGKDGDKAVETQVLLHEFDVPNTAFSAEVMACLPPAGWTITEDLVRQRTDLRHIPVVSIDPPGCKDIDDALHCVRLPNGNLEAGVHIADVTHFVHPDTPLDKEASHRSTSTYLVERRLDMLPGLLTTQLCSLRSKEDHLAFSVIWEMDDQGHILDVKFCKSVIHSVASLTYDEAQAMLDDPTRSDEVCTSVKALNMLARQLRQRRIDEGALTLASPEVRFKLDSETQNPTDVSMYALKESNALVEEWMLLANITVSKKILRHYPTLGVLRRHQPPSREQFAPLMAAAAAVGAHLDISSSKTLADSLDACVRPEDPYFNKLLRIMATRCMMPAQYFCSGEIDKSQWHHYGLAAPVYTHFTSPIRRYADIIVHRLLSSAIGVIALPSINADRTRQQELCSHMNRRHRAAQYAQRASVSLHTLLYFKQRPSVETAYVLSVASEKIVVIIPRFGIEGTILLQPLATSFAEDEQTKGNEVTADVNYDMVQHRVEIVLIPSPSSSSSSSSSSSTSVGRKKSNDGSAKSSSSTLMDTEEGGAGGGSSRCVWRIQVFQPMQVSIRVKEGRAGSRTLVVGAVIDGRDYAEPISTGSKRDEPATKGDEDQDHSDMMIIDEDDGQFKPSEKNKNKRSRKTPPPTTSATSKVPASSQEKSKKQKRK